jgi:hypothetical protein
MDIFNVALRCVVETLPSYTHTSFLMPVITEFFLINQVAFSQYLVLMYLNIL